MFVTTTQGQTHVFVSDLATEAGKAKIPLAIRFRANDAAAGGAQPVRREQKEIEQGPGFRQVYSAKTNQSGEAWSEMANPKTVLVRQGTELIVLDFQTQKKLGAVQVGQYERIPRGISGSCYFELHQQMLLRVDINTFKIERVPLLEQIPVDLLQSSSFQFQDVIVIQSKDQLLGYDF